MRWFTPDVLPSLQHETVSALAALASTVLGAGREPVRDAVRLPPAGGPRRRGPGKRRRDRGDGSGEGGRSAAVW